MSAKVFQPIGQKRLTNIAVVRIKKHGKRFEIACYKNKVVNWRNGVEKDIDEVLQTSTIFSNVSKGILAKKEDLIQAFGTDDEAVICRKILSEGELQVSDKERKVELDTLFRDVASVLSEKCINPETNRPYTISMLERALKDVHFSVDPKRPAKIQALEALPMLQKRFPIERARMRLRIVVPLTSGDELKELLAGRQAVIEEQDLVAGQMLSVICLVDPGAFRQVHSLVQQAGAGGRLDVVALAATAAETTEEVLEQGVDRIRISEHDASGTSEAKSNVVVLDADNSGRFSGLQPPASTSGGVGFSGFASIPVSAPSAGPRQRQAVTGGIIVYSRGPIHALPDDHASRKERFAELDALQPGWTVELRRRGGEGAPLDAVFYSPDGEKVGLYANARRMALQASKALA